MEEFKKKSKNILETNRLIIREVVETDAEFILNLMNQPSFIRYIGARGVDTLEKARDVIENKYRQCYRDFGYGLYIVALKKSAEPIGFCGFIKCDFLPDADIGFAFLPQFEKKGFAFESDVAVMNYGVEILKLTRVLAITVQNNHSSINLLKKLGFVFERLIKTPYDSTKLKLFSFEVEKAAQNLKMKKL